MKYILLLTPFVLSFSVSLSGQTQWPSLVRGAELVIPLDSGPLDDATDWGPLARDADHGRVAINSEGDMLVVYQTTRTDMSDPEIDFDLKQVEIAYFEYEDGSTPNRWGMQARALVGRMDRNVLGNQQDTVKCERPIVISVGSRFLVAWTRRYDYRYQGNPAEEPAVLECVWVDWDGQQLNVNNGGFPEGQGFPLDLDYDVRECGGVPTVVNLHDANSPTTETVGLVYPHQTAFDFLTPNLRDFDLRLVTCTLDTSTGGITSSPPIDLNSGVIYNGPTAPGGTDTAILVIPDLAPATDPNTFWLTYEEQRVVAAGIQSRIHVEFWDASSGSWTRLLSQTFQNIDPPIATVKRRPKIDSMGDYPGAINEEVTLVYNMLDPTNIADTDVFHNEFDYDPTLGGGPNMDTVAPPFLNTTFRELTPIPVHGQNGPVKMRRVYFEKTDPSDAGIFYYDQQVPGGGFQRVSTLGSPAPVRPHVTYSNLPLFSVQTVAVTWEDLLYDDPNSTTDYLRVVLQPGD